MCESNGVRVLDSSRDAIREEVKQWPTGKLRTELVKLLGWSAETLVRLAVVVTELEDRGEDLTSMRFALLPILRKIAEGTLIPDIVVLYSGQPALIKSIGKLPIEKQKRIVSGEDKPEKKKPSGQYAPRGYVDRNDEPKPTQLSVQSIVSKAGAKDIADMIADMILQSADRVMVLRHLVNRLASEGIKLQ